MATEQADFGPTEYEPRSRGRVVSLGLGAIVALGLVWFLFLRGGGPQPSKLIATMPPSETSTEQQADETVASAKDSPIETFEIFAPKDPFDPLISTAPVTTGPAVATGLEQPEEATPGVAASAGTTTITTNTSESSSTSSDAGRRVKVVDVFKEDGGSRAQIQVNGTVYTIGEGERFAENFELVSASNSCATMLFGDDEFTLCEGEEILK
jgi:hypothetical protein